MYKEQNELRTRLNYVVNDIGVRASKISVYTHIERCRLSNFKNGKLFLCRPEAVRLQKYLDNFWLLEA